MAKTEEMTNFTFKIDKKTREEYSALCNEFGISMSSATLALIRQAVRSQSIYLSTSDENGFTPQEADELKCRIADVKKGTIRKRSLIEEDE